MRFHVGDWLLLLVVMALAAATRFGYLALAVDNGHGQPALVVQGEPPRRDYPEGTELRGSEKPSELDDLVHHVREGSGMVSLSPLADKEEKTAHVAPGYYWLFGQLSQLDLDADATVRWLQAGLGVLTVGCYYFFARRAFGSCFVAFLTGVLAALHPFWILNCAELQDGTLATFLLALALMLGARGTQSGGVLTSLVFGVALGGLAMVRAALLPFALVALLWFLLRCRHVRLGWLCALLAFLGFANVQAPWAVRNFKTFGEPVPIIDSTYLHLWMGNNQLSTGGPQSEATLRDSLPKDRLDEMLKEENQVRRYAVLGPLLVDELRQHPQEFLTRRIQATLAFWLGENWFIHRDDEAVRRTFARPTAETANVVAPPPWLEQWSETALQASWLLLVVLGLLGWRFSFGWRQQSRMAALALVWVPLPYLLSHAEFLSGPRLPLDGVLICFTAFAVAHLDPRLAREPRPEPEERKKKSK